MIHWNGNKRKLLLIQIPWNHSQAYIIHRLLGMAPRVEFLATSSRDVKIFSFFLREPIFLLCSSLNAHTYACMHARTHARARAHTHTHTRTNEAIFDFISMSRMLWTSFHSAGHLDCVRTPDTGNHVAYQVMDKLTEYQP